MLYPIIPIRFNYTRNDDDRSDRRDRTTELSHVSDWPFAPVFGDWSFTPMWDAFDDVIAPFDSAFRTAGNGLMRCDLKETDSDYELKADIPGAKKDDIDVQFDDESVLTVTYERKADKGESASDAKCECGCGDASEKCDCVDSDKPAVNETKPVKVDGVKVPTRYVTRERSYTKVTRSFRLPDGDRDAIHARYADGVLTVTVGKKHAKPVDDGGSKVVIE